MVLISILFRVKKTGKKDLLLKKYKSFYKFIEISQRASGFVYFIVVEKWEYFPSLYVKLCTVSRFREIRSDTRVHLLAKYCERERDKFLPWCNRDSYTGNKRAINVFMQISRFIISLPRFPQPVFICFRYIRVHNSKVILCRFLLTHVNRPWQSLFV